MADQSLPSDAELQLLQALWEQPGSTVQEVHGWGEKAGKVVGYTTVLKQLQRMHTKGLVTRERQGRQHHYHAAQGREETEAALVEHLSDTVFSGSAVRLALKALGDDPPSAPELEELEQWIAAQKKQP
jgi:predicted transcriptional regulator